MNRIALTLIGVAALALGACDGPSNSLADGRTNADPSGTGGGGGAVFDHAGAGGTDVQAPDTPAATVQSSPEVTSRLHACGKISVAALGTILTSRGLTGGGTRPAGSPSGLALYGQPGTAPALGGANYAGRAAEAAFASTAAMATMFDIFTMASYDPVASAWSAPACPGVKVLGADGKFTKDGLSCLIGKPAKDEHLAIANDAIVKNPADGAKLAIAALLAAAHTCQ